MATDMGTGSIHTHAGREYIGSLSPLVLIEFQNHVRGSHALHAPVLTRGKQDFQFYLHHQQRSDKVCPSTLFFRSYHLTSH
jgi:hypothetical protein